MAQEFNSAFEFLQRAHKNPSAIAFRAHEAEMSYGALRDRVVSYALHMRQRGVVQGACVALEANRLPEGPALALAAGLLGAAWIKLSPDIPAELKVSHIFSIQVPKVIPGPNFHIVDAAWTADPPGTQLLAPHRFDGYANELDISSYSQSSGTTGRPKAIPRHFRESFEASTGWFSSDLPDIVHAEFPPLSAAGLSLTMNTLLRGGTLVAIARDFSDLQSQGVRLVSASPAQADRLCNTTPPATRIPRLLLMGAAVTPSLLRGWLRFFERVDVAYGAQELGGGGLASFTEAPDELVLKYTMPANLDVQAVDEAGAVCPPDVPGILRLRGPHMAHTYIGAPEATAETFRDGWFHPGDLGMVDAEGRVRILGRAKDQFNIGGVKANAADIDAAAARAFGVAGAVSFIRPVPGRIDELCVLAMLQPGADPVRVAAEIRRHCRLLRHGLVPAAVYFAPQLPLSENGKVDRDAARALTATMYSS